MAKQKVKGDCKALDDGLKQYLQENFARYRNCLSEVDLLHAALQCHGDHFHRGFLRDTKHLPCRERAEKYWLHVYNGYRGRYDAFCEALKSINQHLALQYLIPGYETVSTEVSPSFCEDDRTCLHEKVKRDLEKSYYAISETLDVDGTFVSQLRAFGGFTENNLQDYEEKDTPTTKANAVLDAVLCGNLRKYKALREAFKATGKQQLDQLLLPMPDVEKLHKELLRSPAVEGTVCNEPPRVSGVQESTWTPTPCSDGTDGDALQVQAGAGDRTSLDRNSAADDDFIRNTVMKNIRAQKAYVIKCSLEGKRGRVLIINNVNFNNADNNRKGAEVDERNLVDLFTFFNYKVVLHRDKTAAEIKEILEDEQKNEDHKLADSFIFFILSHGFSNVVCGCDNEPLSLESIMEYFDGDNCPNLAKKPKLFFVQACQEGQTVTDAIKTLSLTDDKTVHKEGHPKSHAIMVVAACPGYVAFRCEQTGSLFVQAICDIFKKSSASNDVQEMLNELKRSMDGHHVPCEGVVHNMLCDARNDRLCKKMYLLPVEILQKYGNELFV